MQVEPKLQPTPITYECYSHRDNTTLKSHIQLIAPNTQVRMPVSIVAVLDISGSMDSEATQGQSKESDGFSRLDLVKHSVNTIVQALHPEDELGIVTFSDQARVDFKLGKMNQNNKKKAKQFLDALKTEGSTNLWAGINQGLTLAQQASYPVFVLVLTDGEPNQHPPGGQVQTFEEYLKTQPLKGSVSMFGYGYQLNTPMLSALSELGAGCYGYIPDCSMVGTIFVNFLSGALANHSALVTAKVELSVDGTLIEQPGFKITLNGQPSSISNLGSLSFTGKKNLFLTVEGLSDQKQIEVSLRIKYGQFGRLETVIKVPTASASSTSADPAPKVIPAVPHTLKVQELRFRFIKFLAYAPTLMEPNYLANAVQAAFDDLCKAFKNLHAEHQDDVYLASLLHDMESPVDAEGQVGKAITQIQWWRKWGRHYFPALRIAHKLELCTNFKDPGIQSYASSLFTQLEQQIDVIFVGLAPPKPSVAKYDAKGQQVNNNVVNMGRYYNRGGGCMHPDCNIKMADGSKKRLGSLKKGDLVQTQSGPSEVECIVATLTNGSCDMVHLQWVYGALIITPYHPILDQNSKWVFPCTISPAKPTELAFHITLLVANRHPVAIEQQWCCTLAHNQKGDVIGHDYLGTNKVVKDIQSMQGWNDGWVWVEEWIRSEADQRIVGVVGVKSLTQSEKEADIMQPLMVVPPQIAATN